MADKGEVVDRSDEWRLPGFDAPCTCLAARQRGEQPDRFEVLIDWRCPVHGQQHHA